MLAFLELLYMNILIFTFKEMITYNKQEQKMTSSRDYSKGKIYKIEPICDHDEGDIYIGSTTKQYLSQRMTKHKSNYLSWRNNPQGKTPKLNSFDLFDKYGLNKCHIILIKNFPCSSKDELYAGEALQIKNVKCVNKHVPFRTEEEKKEIKLAYTLQNKAHKKVYDQEYRQKTKDMIQHKPSVGALCGCCQT